MPTNNSVFATARCTNAYRDNRVNAHEKGRANRAPVSPFRLAFAVARQRLENWKLRRALALPYFLRSTTRLSRVRKPPR